MKLEDIYREWDKDCVMDRTALDHEAINIPKLHNKYYKLYTAERLLLKRLNAEMKQLTLAKHEFYTQGPTSEQAKEWELPAKGLILKNEVPMYMEADKELIAMSLKIGHQEEKIDLLESIIKNINNRQWQIGRAIDFIRWTSGG